MSDGKSPFTTTTLTSDAVIPNSSSLSPCSLDVLDPDRTPFLPKTRAVKPKLVSRQSVPRHIPPPLIISPPVLKPHFTRKLRSARTSLTTVLHPRDASLYASHFPPGHLLEIDFVSKYAPGVEIGKGAYGFVITAVDIRLDRGVAVKFIEKRKIPSWGWHDDPELGRIPTEIALLRALDHPGIIKFIDLFQDSTYFYFVQELHGSPWYGKNGQFKSKVPVATNLLTQDFTMDAFMTDIPQTPPSPMSFFSSPDKSPQSSASLSSPESLNTERLSHDLFECIEENKHLPECLSRYIFRQIVDVVHYLDQLGVVHRDIKDENVLIDNKYRIKLIDFGSASGVEDKDLHSRPWYRDFRGTLAYAPPEIVQRVKFHQAEPVEIWSLGLLLAFLLTGRNPFPTEDDVLRGNIVLRNCKIVPDGEPINLLYHSSSSKEPIIISSLCYDLLTRCLDPDPLTRATIAEVKAHAWLLPEYLA
ncbi:hypothetical protein Clacol_000290 [Clathrus columnatus]|uniref:Protein kinase domain-containing protein n=1 Tax=Clathrus columnatus TaxID=1419009 RepID=A0AAV4ZZB6_9AGAM|nr:hypothetical protein Clacol_000290 [Clathrus columnatus]